MATEQIVSARQPPEGGLDRAVLRVMTWNVMDLKGDRASVVRVIRTARPDVLCLQEVPRRVLSRNRLAELARSCGLYAGDGGRPSGGTALLTSLRAEIGDVGAHRLPVHGLLTRPRGYVRASVGLPGTRHVSVTSMHLGLDESQRADHVERLLAGLTDDLPAVLCGDLNERPDGRSWAALQGFGRDPDPRAPKTFRASAPKARIDVVLVDPRLEVLSYGDPAGVDEADVLRASDHRPVLAEVRLPSRRV